MHSTAAPPLPRRLVVLLSIASFNVIIALAGENENPFTPKGYIIRYWRNQISNELPKPSFLLDKASPLTAADSAVFSKLADDPNSLSAHLPDFCSKANLLCFPDPLPSLEKHRENVDFAAYQDRNFNNYGSDRLGAVDSFKNYSDGENVVSDDFRRYSRDATGHGESFTSYAENVNMADQSFKGYGNTATGGEGEFTAYNSEINVPHLRFASYSANSNGRKQSFSQYTDGANSGEQKFTSYGKNGNGAKNEFTSYGNKSNVMISTFKNYDKTGNGGNDTFTSYGDETNVPQNTFKSYSTGANGAVQSFKGYRTDSNTGTDEFQSYGKKSDSGESDFESYGHGASGGSSKFSGYGKDNCCRTILFNTYDLNFTFKGYAKKGVSFANYLNATSPPTASPAEMAEQVVNKWVVEPGKFFREEMLKNGTIMPMPDIQDKMPERSFLPRSIVSKLPFSTSAIADLKKIFHARADSSMASMISSSLKECERAPSPGEKKRCVASIEDMIDFATSVLGRNVAVRTTENTQGRNGEILIGHVSGIDGGNVTESVSCHQSLFPFLLYYCHSVPKVRVYEADILDPDSKAKINHGVAICHLDTSSWSPGHGAFIALGSGPGKIEVCHWIFENDMTWTVAD